MTKLEIESFEMKTVLMVGLFCAAMSVYSAVDPGGVSVDFRKNIGNEVVRTGENFVPGGSFESEADFKKWLSSHWVHLAAADGDFNALYKQVQPLAQREWKNGSVRIFTDPKAKELKNAKGQVLMISNRISRNVSVPGTGKYLLSFQLSGKFLPWSGFNGFRVAMRGLDKDNKPCGKEFVQIYPLSEQGAVQKLEIIVPEGTVSVVMDFAMYGIGEAVLDNVSLSKEKMTAGLTAKLVPFAMLDNTFCIPEKCRSP